MTQLEKILELIMTCSSINKVEKEVIINKLEFMADWQLHKLYEKLFELKQAEEMFISDSRRIDLKFQHEIQKLIEKD